MQSTITGMFRSAALLVVALGAVACGLENQEAPSLIGPSGYAQSVTLSATPDRLPRDGSSQSVITVTVRNESGQGVSGQRLTLGSSAGTLSQGDVVTGSDGRATFTLTAPQPGSTGNSVEVFATPVGGNADNAVTRSVSLAVTGTPNSTAPSPQFTMTPETPGTRETVTFDARATTDEGGVCGNACTYNWNFGDGTTRTGSIVTHSFTTPGTFTVTLSVTDAGGATVTRQRVVTVSNIPAPTVSISVAPNPPLAGQQATFIANAVVRPGRSITSYAWNFGDGTTQTTTAPTVTKTYTAQGVYVVTVTATQDTGETGSASQQLSISNSAATATISFSPTNPLIGQVVSFTALNPSAPNGAAITSFEWNFGDPSSGSNNEASGQSATHTFSSANTFVVRLTVRDSNGIVGVTTTSVTVSDPSDD